MVMAFKILLNLITYEFNVYTQNRKGKNVLPGTKIVV